MDPRDTSRPSSPPGRPPAWAEPSRASASPGRPNRHLRASDREWEAIAQQAMMAGFSRSRFIRALAVGEEVEARHHALTYRVLYQLDRIANNLRQVRKVAREAVQPEVVRASSKLIKKVWAWIDSPPEEVTEGASGAGASEDLSGVRRPRTVRISDAEWAELETLGRQAGMAPSTFLRELVLSVDLTPKRALVRRSALARLQSLGRELNALTRQAHEHRTVVWQREVARVMAEISGWLDRTLEAAR